MQTQPDISVLIPVYNRENFIADCIQSAINQTYKNIEIIVVDNASTDSTWEICQEIASKDTRVRIFRNDENIGPVRNWIRCVELARGALSKILFSDDLLEPDCLQEMAPALVDPSVGIVYCSTLIGESRENSSCWYRSEVSTVLCQPEFLKRLLSGSAPVSPGAILIRTIDLKKNLHSDFPTTISRPFSENGAGPDVMISLLTSKSYPLVSYVNKPLVFFRSHPDSFTISNTGNYVSEGYVAAISFYLKNNENWTTWAKYTSTSWASLITHRKKWANPSDFYKKHEGKGSIFELLAGVYFVTIKIIKKTYQKLVP